MRETGKRKLYGYVEQSFHIVPGTVRDQITLYDKTITDRQVQVAAELTGLKDTIEAPEHGYDTECTPELFSQGQWQLLSIARAAVSEPNCFCWMRLRQIWMQRLNKEVLQALKRVSESDGYFYFT